MSVRCCCARGQSHFCDLLLLAVDVDGDTEASVVTGSQSCQDSKPGEGYKGGAEAEPSAMRHLATPTRLNTTIYMETVQFLLQNNALQVSNMSTHTATRHTLNHGPIQQKIMSEKHIQYVRLVSYYSSV